MVLAGVLIIVLFAVNAQDEQERAASRSRVAPQEVELSDMRLEQSPYGSSHRSYQLTGRIKNLSKAFDINSIQLRIVLNDCVAARDCAPLPHSAHGRAKRYNAPVTPDDVRAFVHRDWDALAASKTAYWAERFQNDGWQPAWQAADALLLEMRRARPDYPDEQERTLDFSAHLVLRSRLDRAADAFSRR
jgi:hypothetical protein